jgi:hypothetical protein
LTEGLVRRIREAIARGEGQRSIARREGVAKSTVHSIKTGHNWRHVA